MDNFKWSTEISSGFKPSGDNDFPLMKAKDVLMPDGTRLSDFNPVTSIPVFDISTLGTINCDDTRSSVILETDTTALIEALKQGPVCMCVSFSVQSMTFTNALATGLAIVAKTDDSETCTWTASLTLFNAGSIEITVTVTPTSITGCGRLVREVPTSSVNEIGKVLGVDTYGRASWVDSKYPIVEGINDSYILPDTYYTFGEVDGLELRLTKSDDGYAHEYTFEFIPSENFTGLTITPAPAWANEPQFTAGKTCQVSIMRGIGVIVCA